MEKGTTTYWYLIKAPDGTAGWAEADAIIEKLEYEREDNSNDREGFVKSADLDLNNDGSSESIYLELDEYDFNYFDQEQGKEIHEIRQTGAYILHINDLKVEDHVNDNCYGFKILDIDPDDKYRDILVFSQGPCADSDYVIYRFDGNNIIRTGLLYDRFEIHNKYIQSRQRGDVGDTVYKYIIDPKTEMLSQVKQDLYYKGLHAMVGGEIKIYDDREMKQVNAVLDRDDIAEIVAVDRDESAEDYQLHGWEGESNTEKNYWYLIRTQDDVHGWARISEIEGTIFLPPN
jgi:hypothetical protein